MMLLFLVKTFSEILPSGFPPVRFEWGGPKEAGGSEESQEKKF